MAEGQEKNQLQILVEKSELDSTKAAVLLERFQDYFKIAAEWETRAKTIVVTDAGQTADMKMARVGRLELREKRIAIEKTRKELKEQSLREGKAIDGIANVLKALIVPIEDYLGEQEKFTEIQAQKEVARLVAEAEAKAEAERLAKEQAECEEQERISKENERLKREAAKKEKARLALEAKVEAERVAKEKALADERAKVEAERIAREKIYAEERAKAKEKARLEREKVESAARAEREKAEKEQRRLQAEKDAAEKAARDERKKAEAEKKAREREEAERKAAEVECPYCHKRFVPA